MGTPQPGYQAIQGTQRSGRFIEHGEHYAPLPDKNEDGRITAHAVQTISADASELYALWTDLTLIPRWQEHVVSVTPIGLDTSHWVLGNPEDPDGKRTEFDSRLTEDIADGKLAWSSITPEFEQTGSVTFVPSPSGRGTVVTLIQTVKMPGGSLGNLIAGAGERGPKQTVIENLRHFKQLAETGEIPSVKGQPHGPRGATGGFKEWLYGETNPTLPGTSERE